MGFPDRIERTMELAHRKTYDGHTAGWALELGELADYLDAA